MSFVKIPRKKQNSNFQPFFKQPFCFGYFLGKLFLRGKVQNLIQQLKVHKKSTWEKTSIFFSYGCTYFLYLATGLAGPRLPHPRHPPVLWRPLALEMSVRIPTFRGIFAITMPSSRAFASWRTVAAGDARPRWSLPRRLAWPETLCVCVFVAYSTPTHYSTEENNVISNQ